MPRNAAPSPDHTAGQPWRQDRVLAVVEARASNANFSKAASLLLGTMRTCFGFVTCFLKRPQWVRGAAKRFYFKAKKNVPE